MLQNYGHSMASIQIIKRKTTFLIMANAISIQTHVRGNLFETYFMENEKLRPVIIFSYLPSKKGTRCYKSFHCLPAYSRFSIWKPAVLDFSIVIEELLKDCVRLLFWKTYGKTRTKGHARFYLIRKYSKNAFYSCTIKSLIQNNNQHIRFIVIGLKNTYIFFFSYFLCLS